MFNNENFPYVGTLSIKPTEKTYQDVYPVLCKKGEDKIILPTILRQGEEIVLDFKEEYVGDVHFLAQAENSDLTAIYGEALEEVYSTKAQNSNDWYTIPVDSLQIKANLFHYKSSGRRAFRYLRLICASGTAEVQEVKVVAEHCKITNEETFVSNDEELLKIWDICKRTTLLCMQDFLEDGVKRDGCLWVSDARLQAICDYALFKQTEIVKKSLLLFAESQSKEGIVYANAIIAGGHQHPDRIRYMFDYVQNPNYQGEPEFYEGCGLLHYVQYGVDFINMAWEYYEASEDKETLKVLLPFLRKDLAYLESLKTEDIIPKLLPAPMQATKVRANVDQGGLLSTYYACFVYALKNYIRIIQLFNEQEEAQRVDQEVETYTKIVRGYFAKGTIIDKDKMGAIMHPVSALSMAFLAGILSKDEYIRVLNNIRGKESYIVDGYWIYWKIRAKFEAGLIDEAIADMKEYWGTMLKYGATTCWEQFDRENMYILEDFVISRCHGWSAGAADLLKRYVEKK